MQTPEGYEKYGEFEEGGYTFQAFLPTSTEVPMVWILRACTEDRIVRTREIPLSYEPRFGPDVDDVAKLEEATEDLIRELA